MKMIVIGDLSRASEFRQTVETRPPKAILGTQILLCSLLASALAWAGWTKADLVVRAPGRVRPAEGVEYKVVAPRRGRVSEVHFRMGEAVKKGGTLAVLDTERLRNDIAKLRKEREAAGEEIRQLETEEKLTLDQGEAAKDKAQAELSRAKVQAREAAEKRASEIRQAQIELADAQEEEKRLASLAKQGIVSEAEWKQSASKLEVARERLARARIPLDDGGIAILKKAVELVEREYELHRAKLLDRRARKVAEIAASEKTLANLELERAESVLSSPADGVAIAGEPKIGDLLEAGTLVVSIAPQSNPVLEIPVLASEIGELREGMEARIRMEAYDHQKYGTVTGRILFISPDSQAVEGTVVYKVRLALDRSDLGPGRPIQLGMTGIAEIRTGQDSLLSLLVKKIRKGISLG